MAKNHLCGKRSVHYAREGICSNIQYEIICRFWLVSKKIQNIRTNIFERNIISYEEKYID